MIYTSNLFRIIYVFLTEKNNFSFKSQVVAGIKYFIEGVFKFKGEIKEQKCKLIVFAGLNKQNELLEKKCSNLDFVGIEEFSKLDDQQSQRRVLNRLQAVNPALFKRIKVKSISEKISDTRIDFKFECLIASKKGGKRSCSIVFRVSLVKLTQKIIENNCM